MKVSLITGITGQDGSYLADLLISKNYKVYGIVRRTSTLYTSSRLDHLKDNDNFSLRYGDMSDGSGLGVYLRDIVNENKNMDVLEIYNLAAQSHVKVSFDIPEYTSDIDGIGVLRLLEVIRSFPDYIKRKIKFYQAGTSEMYGAVLETPQTETTPFNPVSPYAVSKVYAYYIVKCYREGYGIFASNGILFNHESPRRGANFLTMKVVNAVKDIVNGNKEFVELGNLDSRRDWGHAIDYVRGMWLMLQQNEPGDFVLATGKTCTVRKFVTKAFAYKNIKILWRGEKDEEVGVDDTGVVRVKVNRKYCRPCEVDLLLGDASKATKELGWSPTYTLDALIKDMFEQTK